MTGIENLKEAGLVSTTFEIPLELPVRNSESPSPTKTTGQVFFGSEENLLVLTALRSLLESAANAESWPYSPLVLCGCSGTGKSMIANCLAGQWIREVKTRNVLVATGADFRRSYSQAVSDDCVEAWRDRCRAASFAIVDDVHQLQRGIKAQREFVLLLDDLQSRGVPVIVTMPAHPASTMALLPQLTSRLSVGLTIEVQSPSTEARYRILSKMVDQQPHRLDDSAVRWFAERYQGNVPSLRNRLHGSLALGRTVLNSATSDCRDSIDRATLKRFINAWESRQKYSMKEITRVVCRYCQISREKILGSSRKPPIVQARSIAMVLCKSIGGFSLREIGHIFGGRDHSTVLHACQKIGKQSKTDPTLRLTLDELRRILANESNRERNRERNP